MSNQYSSSKWASTKTPNRNRQNGYFLEVYGCGCLSGELETLVPSIFHEDCPMQTVYSILQAETEVDSFFAEA